MNKKYDKDYQHLIEKLNDLFLLEKGESEDNAEPLKGIIVEKRKLIENIP